MTLQLNKFHNWMEVAIWPQIERMMMDDAMYRLFCRARELTGAFDGPIGTLVHLGYVEAQTIAIRRLTDTRADVISLARLLIELKSGAPKEITQLANKLRCCEQIGDLVNNHIAHKANPARNPNYTEWTLSVGSLVNAQRAICEVAVAIDRDLLNRDNPIAIIPTPQFDILNEFRGWLSPEQCESLSQLWDSHCEFVDGWTNFRLR